MSDVMPPGRGIRELLRSTLTERMRARDRDAVSALRVALAAIDNAEAVPVDEAARGPLTGGSADLATPRLGGGAAEAARRVLAEDEMRAIVASEATERAELGRRLSATGASDAARVASEQAAHLRFLLDVAADRASGR